MTFNVRELRRATADKRQIFAWLHERSQRGALAWLAAYDEMVARLQTGAAAFGEAYEQDDLDLNVKQALFKTRRGRVYRALFHVDGTDVYILRVRGPGQDPVTPGEFDAD